MFDFKSAIVWFFDFVNVFIIVDLFLRLMLLLKGVMLLIYLLLLISKWEERDDCFILNVIFTKTTDGASQSFTKCYCFPLKQESNTFFIKSRL